MRGSLPNRYCDPATAAQLFEECLDEYRLCDEMGLNIISNEHHAGINCLYGASPLILGILARETKNVRILSLGTLVTARPDPVRIAEEYATADVISRGRLDIGFVKSGGSEMASANSNPIGNLERFWESIDLIKKALTAHDGPVSWEGKHFTHRHINIWPPCYQRPHPPLWAATGDPETSVELARRDIINATFVRGPDGTKKSWDAYKQARKDAGMAPAGARPLRLYGIHLCRRQRRRRHGDRRQVAVVPAGRGALGGAVFADAAGNEPARAGAAALPQCAAAQPRPAACRLSAARLRRSATSPPSRPSRAASCSPATQTPSTARSWSSTTRSAGSST